MPPHPKPNPTPCLLLQLLVGLIRPGLDSLSPVCPPTLNPTPRLLLQLLVGLIRPGLDSPKRPTWNLVHWWLGRLTILVAWTTIYLGCYIFNVSIYQVRQAGRGGGGATLFHSGTAHMEQGAHRHTRTTPVGCSTPVAHLYHTDTTHIPVYKYHT